MYHHVFIISICEEKGGNVQVIESTGSHTNGHVAKRSSIVNNDGIKTGHLSIISLCFKRALSSRKHENNIYLRGI